MTRYKQIQLYQKIRTQLQRFEKIQTDACTNPGNTRDTDTNVGKDTDRHRALYQLFHNRHLPTNVSNAFLPFQMRNCRNHRARFRYGTAVWPDVLHKKSPDFKKVSKISPQNIAPVVAESSFASMIPKSPKRAPNRPIWSHCRAAAAANAIYFHNGGELRPRRVYRYSF